MATGIENVSKALVKEIVWAGAKEVLKYFMQDKSVKYAYVKLLLDSGLTVSQIREFVEISPATITEIRKKDANLLQDALLDTLREREISKLYMIGTKMLNRHDKEEVLDKMKGGELAYAYKVLLDSRRLLENKSTSNISVQLQALNSRFEEDEKRITKLLSGIAVKKPDVIEAEVVENAAT